MRIVRAKDYEDMSRKAGNIMAAQVVAKPDCVLGLATGSTPIGAYKRLIEGYEAGDLDFSQVKTYNLDEYRGLPGTHDQSYRYFMNVNLFDHVNIDKANTHVPDGLAEDYEAACAAYDEAVAKLEELQAKIDENTANIAEIEAQLPEAQERASEALKELYKFQKGSNPLAGLVLNAESLSDFITTCVYMNQIQSSSNEAIENLNAMQQELEQQKVQ